MYFCYLDESGGAEPSDQGPTATPLMVIAGLIFEAGRIPALTRDFLRLKRQFFGGRFTTGPALDHILVEIKGSEILQSTRTRSRNKRRQMDVFRSAVLYLVSAHGGRIVGRVWVKEDGMGLKPDSTYCYAVQSIARHFNRFLVDKKATGLMIADSRVPKPNITVAHSIFTQKWRAGLDPYPKLLEVPVFAHSENHVGIQLADLIASTFIFPMAVSAYGAPPCSVHATSRYDIVRVNHGARLSELQYRYPNRAGNWCGGITVNDPGKMRSGALLFGP